LPESGRTILLLLMKYAQADGKGINSLRHQHSDFMVQRRSKTLIQLEAKKRGFAGHLRK
jgi:hypothetical protein